MDYKEKYEQALERARQIHSKTEFDYEKGMMEEIFPELKESEDELTWLTKYIEEEAYSLSMDIRDNEDRIKLKNLRKSLAWLEKQGENTYNKELSELLHKVICRFIDDPNIPYTEREKVSMEIIPYVERLEKQGESKCDDDELLMVITWFSRIKQLATDMTTWNNHHVRNAQECLQEILLVVKEALEYLNKQGEQKPVISDLASII